jgi:dodecin
MPVVKVIDIMAQSEESWEDAARQAVVDVAGVYPDILSLRVNRFEAVVEGDEITFFRVKMKVAHVLDAGGSDSEEAEEQSYEDEQEQTPHGRQQPSRQMSPGAGAQFGGRQDDYAPGPSASYGDDQFDEDEMQGAEQGYDEEAPYQQSNRDDGYQPYDEEEPPLPRQQQQRAQRPAQRDIGQSDFAGRPQQRPPRAEPEVSGGGRGQEQGGRRQQDDGFGSTQSGQPRGGSPDDRGFRRSTGQPERRGGMSSGRQTERSRG